MRLSQVHSHLLPLVQTLLCPPASHYIPFIQLLPALCPLITSHPFQKWRFSSLSFLIISQAPSITPTPPSTRGLRTPCHCRLRQPPSECSARICSSINQNVCGVRVCAKTWSINCHFISCGEVSSS